MTRDEFQQILDRNGIVFVGDAAWRVAQLVAAAEREACAKVCEARYMGDNNHEDMEARKCAAAIRERSKA